MLFKKYECLCPPDENYGINKPNTLFLYFHIFDMALARF